MNPKIRAVYGGEGDEGGEREREIEEKEEKRHEGRMLQSDQSNNKDRDRENTDSLVSGKGGLAGAGGGDNYDPPQNRCYNNNARHTGTTGISGQRRWRISWDAYVFHKKVSRSRSRSRHSRNLPLMREGSRQGSGAYIRGIRV